MREEEVLAEEVLSILKRAGFRSELIEYPKDRRSIDIVSYSDNDRLLLKTIHDLSEITRYELSDLRKARTMYRASTVIIGVEEKGVELENEVVYYKYNNVVITPETFERYLVHKEKPLVACIRGSYVLKINPEKFRTRREETRHSRGSLAEAIGTSTKTIYMYERGEMYISLDKGLKLASILGEDIFEEFDVLSGDNVDLEELDDEDRPRDSIEEALMRITQTMRYLYTSFARLPIDAVIKAKETISIVKERAEGRESNEKIDCARKFAEGVRTRIIVVRSPRDIARLKKILAHSSSNTQL